MQAPHTHIERKKEKIEISYKESNFKRIGSRLRYTALYWRGGGSNLGDLGTREKPPAEATGGTRSRKINGMANLSNGLHSVQLVRSIA